MEKRIELERRARKANQITELNLDNCRSTSIVGLTDEYTALESLSLINVGLTTLKGFPKLPNLKKLELSDNRISNGLNYLHTSPKLQYLNLSGNKIKDLEALKPLEEFKHLAILDLFNNEATQIENYREKIFEMLPSLRFLDGFDCNDVEAPSEGDDEEDNLNYYDNDEDKQNAFTLNGLEIDLDELEEFEKRVKAKREAKLKQQQENNVTTNDQTTVNKTDNSAATELAEVDELDEYLKTLKLKEQKNEKEITSTTNTTNTTDSTMNSSNNVGTSANFVLLLYWFLAILNLASATFSNHDNESDEENDSEMYGSSDDEDNDVSLSEVYNDDLEEDEDEWDEENAAENDDDEDEDSDEDEANDSAVASNADKDAGEGNANAEETQARGKKRKHEG
ncbi:acidic leucine-rich nuclear phosphoprotein 32 family member A isoform X1 [Lucilia cuprina]|uniref:acidic leucine-rich nuclear phosphoprotein 32 family member A isoform X1 n=1 Tax=Lucilia cuprina TaxID=7375 RepID=UPI001F06C9C2|nr:acidic leucine-rich nuclear phosphoprotein 32 family member A isoform X1 [Lucilia cuprina]XP_046810697.1 acidic leucine-rich nuclear phosphoprotein 32 family member A isoform X1 [Lucilia cuprina]